MVETQGAFQRDLDQSLEMVATQQQELDTLVEALLQDVEQLYNRVPLTQPADVERDKAYQLADSIDSELSSIMDQLNDMIKQLNASAAPASGEQDDPVRHRRPRFAVLAATYATRRFVRLCIS